MRQKRGKSPGNCVFKCWLAGIGSVWGAASGRALRERGLRELSEGTVTGFGKMERGGGHLASWYQLFVYLFVTPIEKKPTKRNASACQWSAHAHTVSLSPALQGSQWNSAGGRRERFWAPRWECTAKVLYQDTKKEAPACFCLPSPIKTKT